VVPLVACDRMSLSAALKCDLNSADVFVVVSIWRHSRHEISERPVSDIISYAHRRTVGLVGSSKPSTANATPYST
jgi:hypothetical protein